jgi:hypothetical protein
MSVIISNSSKKIIIKIKSVQILTGRGPDRISLNFDDGPYNEENSAEIRAPLGKGLNWCKEVLGLKESEIEITVIPEFKTNFSLSFGSKPDIKKRVKKPSK